MLGYKIHWHPKIIVKGFSTSLLATWTRRPLSPNHIIVSWRQENDLYGATKPLVQIPLGMAPCAPPPVTVALLWSLNGRLKIDIIRVFSSFWTRAFSICWFGRKAFFNYFSWFGRKILKTFFGPLKTLSALRNSFSPSPSPEMLLLLM